MPQEHAVITQEMIDQVRARIGVEITPREPYYNRAATIDTIRHFVDGIGDLNPLYRDPDCARKTRYGRIAAPPCFLYSVCWAPSSMGFPGIHAWHSGSDWSFHQPILMDDHFTYTWTMTDLVEKTRSQMANRTFIQYHDLLYKNQKGEVVAKQHHWAIRAERKSSGEKGKYRDIPKAEYTSEELEAIYSDYDKEDIRGANPRYWDDVQVGDELTPVVKGPLSTRDMIAWSMGGGTPFMKAHGIFLRYARRHVAVAMIDSQTGALDVPELVHEEDSRAQEIGIAGAYDYGCQRISWLGHLLTNWMGDDGFLKSLYAELRRFNIVGDTTWCRGRIARKYVDNSEHLVDIECWGENQRREITMPGRATVALLARG
ncbi:MAG: MaoC family dehydratase N-terminal domain-containing protein [Chloroflexi bacterium]|nr:MaoC family dehydratase N-terminal domain-containing protein [Chloroflexota bacterium]